MTAAKAKEPMITDASSATPIESSTTTPVESARSESEKDKKVKELLDKIKAVLESHGGESNIGTRHQYWDWLNELRGINAGNK